MEILLLWLSENALLVAVALINGVIGMFTYKGLKGLDPSRIQKMKEKKLEKMRKLQALNIEQLKSYSAEIDRLEKELKNDSSTSKN